MALFCTVTASQTILPDLLARFRSSHLGVHLALQTGYASEALDRLDDGTADVTVAAVPPRVPRHLLAHVITTMPLVFVALAGQSHAVAADIAAEAAGHEAILSLVSLGRGIGVVPELVADQSPLSAGLEVIPLGDPLPSFDIAACTTSDRLRGRAVAALWSSLTGGE